MIHNNVCCCFKGDFVAHVKGLNALIRMNIGDPFVKLRYEDRLLYLR